MSRENEQNRFIYDITQKLLQSLEVDEEKPDGMLSVGDKYSKWKKGWFTAVSGYFELLTPYISDKSLKELIQKQTQYWVSEKFAGSNEENNTKRHDINVARLLILKVLLHFGQAGKFAVFSEYIRAICTEVFSS